MIILVKKHHMTGMNIARTPTDVYLEPFIKTRNIRKNMQKHKVVVPHKCTCHGKQEKKPTRGKKNTKEKKAPKKPNARNCSSSHTTRVIGRSARCMRESVSRQHSSLCVSALVLILGGSDDIEAGEQDREQVDSERKK